MQNIDKQQVKDKKVLPLTSKKADISPIPSTDEQNLKAEQQRIDKLKEKAKVFVRVGDDYYKIVHRPDKDGNLYKDYLKTSKTTITDDFSRSILKYIPKYDDFVNVPSHTNFKQVINGFFNQYSELTHKPIKGDCNTILGVIKHVFGEHYTNFALDYLQLLYTNPNQRLPILLLESREKNTGKSTFANLIYLIFQDNAIKIGNNDLQSDFNSVWVSRLAIIVDETQLEKQAITQMLKRFSTETGKVTMNEKNKKQREVDFFGKFIFVSNEEGKALKIEKGDPRWAVFKVPTFAKNGIKDNPNIEEQILKEIPAFLHFLTNRKLFYPHKSRMYFDPAVYQTKQLQLYYNNAVSLLAQSIKQLVIDTFSFFPDENILHFSVSEIIDELKNEVRFLNRGQVAKALEIELQIKPSDKRGRYTYCSRKGSELDTNFPAKYHRNNIYYSFDLFEAETWKSTNEEN